LERWATRHDHVSSDVTAIPAADALQFHLKGIARGGGIKQLHAPVTTERDEVQAALVLISSRLDVHSQGL